MACLQVRDRPDGEWSRWYAGIEGFDFKPGFLYELQIDECKVAQPPADGSDPLGAEARRVAYAGKRVTRAGGYPPNAATISSIVTRMRAVCRRS